MIFTAAPLAGAYVMEPRKIEDDRGFFGRILCRDEFRQHGLRLDVPQTNVARTRRRGTMRGLHFQEAPHAEIKIVRCTRGAVYDVIVDLRPESPTFTRWFGVELTEDNFKALYVPEGFAHGYLTLVDDSEVYYHTSEVYHPESATGVRYDDPEFGIVWPIAVEIVSRQDSEWPDFAMRKALIGSDKEMAQ
jgi:dTDP-4-dehydrorhamnose 3,5-epimerase